MEQQTSAPQGPQVPQQMRNDSRQDRINRTIRRKNLKRLGWLAGIGLVAGVLVWLGIWYVRRDTASAPGVYYPEIGREHIKLTEPLPKAYNSNPPSSGAHFPSPANWGVYDYEVNDRFFIHNLEHGGIWIAYRPSVSAHVVEHLKGIANEFGGSKIVMGPRTANDADIAIVAWTRVMKFDLASGDITEAQLESIRSFYKRYKNHGPEFVPDNMPGVDPKTVQ